jgi:hypothetical protein
MLSLSDDDIKPLTNLTSLNCSYTYNITGTGCKNMNLLRLDMEGCHSFLPDNLATMTSIKKLRVASVAGFSYAMAISSLTQLTSLDIIYLCDNITGIPTVIDDTLKQLTNIISLKLGRNDVITGQSLRCLTRLKKLDLCYNPNITDDDLSLISKSLRSLNLQSNKKVVGKFVSNAHNLTKLSLKHNGTFSPTNLILLTSITNLSLYNNLSIREYHLTKLTNLVTLDITASHIDPSILEDNKLPNLIRVTAHKSELGSKWKLFPKIEFTLV